MKLLSCLTFILTYSLLGAQPTIEDFFVTGHTSRVGDHCYQLTPAMDWSSGGVWYEEPIDLNGSFTMELKLMFGCDDVGGADGMVFVFTPFRGASGYQGEGMGFAGLKPSLGIEIDTWENDHLADPPEDHIAILQDGYVMHLFNLAGPVIIPNVEDCKLHNVHINWHQPSHTLSVALDGAEVISYTGDIVGDIFQGNPQVFWGVTAATGRYNNRHEICFEKLEFADPISKIYFGRVEQKKLLMGQVMPLQHADFEEGRADLQDNAHEELYKLINLLKRHPNLDVEIDGHTDSNGAEDENLRLSQDRAQSIADFLTLHGIDGRRLIVRGHGEKFPLDNNATAEGRRNNRRIEIHLFQAKT